MVTLKADKARAQAAGAEASLLVLRVQAHVVLVNPEVATNLVPRVPRAQGDPIVRVVVVRKAPVRKQARALWRVANSCRALAQSKGVSTINIANLAKVVHVALVARAVQVARVAHVQQESPAVRCVPPNKAVQGVRALVLASQRVEQSLDQAIRELRHRKVMIGNRAGPPRMSLGWGLLSHRVVVASELSVFRG
jgi:hypothetical protein